MQNTSRVQETSTKIGFINKSIKKKKKKTSNDRWRIATRSVRLLSSRLFYPQKTLDTSHRSSPCSDHRELKRNALS